MGWLTLDAPRGSQDILFTAAHALDLLEQCICLARTFLYLTLALCTSVQDLDCWKIAALKIIASLEQSYHQPSSILILNTECFSLYISNTQRKKTSKKEKKFVCLSTLIGQCLICVDRYVHEDLTFLSSPLCSIRGYLS